MVNDKILLDKQFPAEEVTNAVPKLKGGKTAGPDKHLVGHLKVEGKRADEHPKCKRIACDGFWREDWQCQYTRRSVRIQVDIY